jgi:hypothetical protein
MPYSAWSPEVAFDAAQQQPMKIGKQMNSQDYRPHEVII